MSANSFEVEFVEFEPGPKGECKYKDFPKAFVLTAGPVDVTTAQGSGAGATFSQVVFYLEADEVQKTSFDKLIGQHTKQTTTCKYSSTMMINKKRVPKKVVTYTGVTFVEARGAGSTGDDKVNLMVTISYMKRDGKVTNYNKNTGAVQ